MDIDIKCIDGKFKLRVSGVIISNNKVLTYESKNSSGLSFPGGRVKIGETTKEAIVREIKEEINLDVEVSSLLCILEDISKTADGKFWQEINYFYRLNLLSEINENDFEQEDFEILPQGGSKIVHKFKWILINELDKCSFRPKKVLKLIIDPTNKHKIITSDFR